MQQDLIYWQENRYVVRLTFKFNTYIEVLHLRLTGLDQQGYTFKGL